MGGKRLAELARAEQEMQRVGIPFKQGCCCRRALHLQPDSEHVTAVVDYNVALLNVRELHWDWKDEQTRLHYEQARERGERPFHLVN